MDLEKNYKLLKKITMLFVMTAIVIILSIVAYADDTENIELGRTYSGVITDDINQPFKIVNDYYGILEGYEIESETGKETVYQYNYFKKFKLTVNETAFYTFENEGYGAYYIILDSNNRNIMGTYNFSENENSDKQKSCILLKSGEEYSVYALSSNQQDNYKFIVKKYGEKLSINGCWANYEKHDTVFPEQKIELTLDGILTISGNEDVWLDGVAIDIGEIQNEVKKIKIVGNITEVSSSGDLFTDHEAGYDGVFSNVESIEIGSNVKEISGVPFRDMKKLSVINFHCKPPVFKSIKELYKEWIDDVSNVADAGIFEGTTTEAHYPAGCKAWNSDVCKNYGGNIKWIADSNLFTDVSPDYWFYDGVNYVNHNKLMTGVGNGAFGPNKATSRAMLATILYRMDGEKKVDEKAAFSDVSSSQYYADAVAWAIKNGIMVGRNNEKFAPNDKATRQELTSAMYQYAKYLGKDVSKQAELSKYKDASMLSSYGEDAREAFAWAVENGIVSGTSDTQLSPSGNASRAQFAVILKRFAENIK